MSVFGVILIRIFPHSDWRRRDTLSISTPNAGKCGPEQLRIQPLFTQWRLQVFQKSSPPKLFSKNSNSAEQKLLELYFDFKKEKKGKESFRQLLVLKFTTNFVPEFFPRFNDVSRNLILTTSVSWVQFLIDTNYQ